MNQYLLSTYAIAGNVEGAPQNQAEVQAFMERVMHLENEMDKQGAFVFGGGLKFYSPEATKVVNIDASVADGPFVESSSQLAGFYIINAADDDAALGWAKKVAEATNHSIEMRPFHQTGRVQA